MISAQTIHNIAVEMGRKCIEFYQKLKDGSNDAVIDDIISDEKEHIQIFHDLFNETTGVRKEESYPHFHMDEDMLIEAYTNTEIFGSTDPRKAKGKNAGTRRIRIHSAPMNTNAPMLSLHIPSEKIHVSPGWSMLPDFVIPDDSEVAGEWSIMFSVDDEGTIYPVKFWLSEKYRKMAGLDHLQKNITIDDWLQLIAKEDQEKMKCHMLPLTTIDNTPGMITYKLTNSDSDSNRVFSITTAIVDERHGNIHVKAVDWFIPELYSSNCGDMRKYVDRIPGSTKRSAKNP